MIATIKARVRVATWSLFICRLLLLFREPIEDRRSGSFTAAVGARTLRASLSELPALQDVIAPLLLIRVLLDLDDV